MLADETNSIDLWTALHDGILGVMRSDLAARTLTLVIDSPFHWEFHQLPPNTRFEILGEGVRSVEAFSFEAWPGTIEPPREMPWDEAQEQRRTDAEKGRLSSTSWTDFANQMGTDEEFIIMNAEIVSAPPHNLFRMGVNSYPSSNFFNIEIRANRFRFFVGKKELSPSELEQFGNAYWDDWSSRSKSTIEDKKEK